MKHYTRAEYIKTYPCHHVSSINPCWWPHASTVSIVPSRCSNNRNDFIFEDLKDSEFDHISKKKNTSKNLEKRYPFWKDSPKLTPTSLRIMSMWHHCNLLRYICIIFAWMIQFPLTVVVSMHWMVSDHQFIAWHHCSIGLRGATVVSFLQSAVICGMFSSWNQIMPSFTCTSEPPPPNFSALANQKKTSPAQKKQQTAMPLTSDPSRLRVTSCQKVNKSSSCTERRRIKRPTSDANDTGFSQGSTCWGQGESREAIPRLLKWVKRCTISFYTNLVGVWKKYSIESGIVTWLNFWMRIWASNGQR